MTPRVPPVLTLLGFGLMGFLNDVVCSSTIYAQHHRGGVKVGPRCVAVHMG